MTIGFGEAQVAWAGSADPAAPLVVLLHGRGADERSILALADHLPEGPAYAAVRAPIAEGGGYAWFANRGIGRPVAASLTATTGWFRGWLDGVAPEGRFFPDTYTYAKGSSDIALLRRAMHAMDRHLEAAWAQRAADTPLKSADEALTLASIVEKETGKASDRGQIAGVFVNRLRVGMLLQTDPTVIYGLGEKFDGNLRKRDLQTDTPWNTYTRAGLPPTPIAMPGKASLMAAVQPQATRALYFVAKGDGTSHFSACPICSLSQSTASAKRNNSPITGNARSEARRQELVHRRLGKREPRGFLGPELLPRLVDRLELGVLRRFLVVHLAGRLVGALHDVL